jgi:hypothetical protein
MSKKNILMVVFAVVLIGGVGGFLNYWKTHQKMGQPGVRLANDPSTEFPPVKLPDWVLDLVGEDLEVTEIEIESLPPDTTITKRRYKNEDGFYIDIMVVLMGLDRTSIHKPQYCLTGAGFQIQETESTRIKISHPVEYDLPAMRLKSSKMYQGTEYSGLLYYWFVDEKHVTEEHYERMWLMARDLFTDGQMQRWAYVTVSSYSLPGHEEPTFKKMREFIKSAVPEFQVTIPKKDNLENE